MRNVANMRITGVVLAIIVAAFGGVEAATRDEGRPAQKEPGAGKDWEIPKDKKDFHIFVCLGQSNMAGGFKESHLYNDRGKYAPVTDPAPRVLTYRAGGWRPAAHPLVKHNKVSFSLPIPFAKKYLELLGDPKVKVGLVAKAYGGKQIGFFVKGNAMYPGGLSGLKKSGTFKGVRCNVGRWWKKQRQYKKIVRNIKIA